MKRKSHILLSLILLFNSGCVPPPKKALPPTRLQEAIESPLTSRLERFGYIEQAQKYYPEQAIHWLGQGLLNTPDTVIAEYYIDKMSQSPEAVIYLCLYGARRELVHEKIKSICEATTGKEYASYLADLIWAKSISQEIAIIDQITLWEYLCRQLSENQIDELVAKRPGSTELTSCLKFYQKKLCYIPTGKGELALCLTLLNEVKENLLEIQSLVNVSGIERFCISDYGLMANLDEGCFLTDRNQLTARISESLSNSSHVSRPPAYKDALNDKTDSFQLQKENLSFCDLVRIDILLGDIENSLLSVCDSLINDHINSEIGGLCTIQEGKMAFVEYPPGQEAGKHRYIESKRTIADSVDAIARWHIHDQRDKQNNLAGPGLDDMEYANIVFSNIIIITILDERDNNMKFNFDLVTPQGRIIDLGVYILNTDF